MKLEVALARGLIELPGQKFGTERLAMQPHHIEVRGGYGGQWCKPGIDQHGIVSAATGSHQDIAGLQPVRLLLAGRLRTKAGRPVNPPFWRGISHLHHGHAAGIDLRDLAAIGVPSTDGGNLVQLHKKSLHR
ncbi:hypothetical protein D3C85_1239230 [compost metagenome]